MPKTKTTLAGTLSKYVNEYKDTFETDGGILLCKICNKRVSCAKKFQVDQHMRSQKHVELSRRQDEKTSQCLLKNYVGNKNEFYMELCESFIAADIPIWKLTNQHLIKFFKKYTQESIPSESTLRKNYVHDIYLSQIEEIKGQLKNHFLWVSIDETTDIQGRFVANILVGILHPDKDVSSKFFLLNVVCLERTNHSTIARAFDDSMQLLGPDFEKSKILLYVTDAAPYMVKSAKALKVFYPKLLHVTCLAHAMHRVAEDVRSRFSDVDDLISNGKKIFLKSALRVEAFKNMFPNIALPPQPILIRWGTWLEAAKYYCENFNEFKTFLKDLNDGDASSILKTKKAMASNSIEAHLAYINSNYSFLPDIITKLEGKKSLAEQLHIVEAAVTTIEGAQGELGEKIREKLNTVLQKNTGFQELKVIAGVLSSSDQMDSSDSCNESSYDPHELSCFKYAPITSVEVERTFSLYKTFLRPNREGFNFQNFKEQFIFFANKASNKED